MTFIFMLSAFQLIVITVSGGGCTLSVTLWFALYSLLSGVMKVSEDLFVETLVLLFISYYLSVFFGIIVHWWYGDIVQIEGG